ncbi:hypothetical protein GF360_00960 [candidate division WWE3 bacterium]|nr:hypothetical protein [candidate division WWE3 bacterium]
MKWIKQFDTPEKVQYLEKGIQDFIAANRQEQQSQLLVDLTTQRIYGKDLKGKSLRPIKMRRCDLKVNSTQSE